MYFCDECRRKNNWPGLIPISRGPCEVCGKTRACYEVRSDLLPLPDPEKAAAK